MLSEAFYATTFSCSMVIATIGMTFCFILIFITATNRSCWNVTNILTCNTAIATASYLINDLIECFYGFHEEWAQNQSLCSFRAYLSIVSCISICYSYMLQAVSRLFLTVLSKHKHWASYRAHWIMIILNWTMALLVSIMPFFYDGALVYEKESRFCHITSKAFIASMYCGLIGFVFPLSISINVYGKIFLYARSSGRAIPLIASSMNSYLPNLKREIIVARNMIITLLIFSSGGVPYLILTLWHGVTSVYSPPEPTYSLSIQLITVCVSLKMVVLFLLNKQIKSIALGYLKRKKQRINPQTIA